MNVPSHQEVQSLEKRLLKAMLESNVSELEALLDTELMFTAQTGTLVNREADLEAHRSGNLKLSKLESSEQQIRCFPGGAIVNVRIFLQGVFADHGFSGCYRYTRVWIQRPAGWKVLAAQATLVP